MSYCDYYLMPLKDRPQYASKEYKCCECGQKIPKGMNYWFYQGTSSEDGSMETYKQHRECREACYLIAQQDECIGFGTLREFLNNGNDTVDYIREAHKLMFAGISASKIKKEDLKYYNASWDSRKSKSMERGPE